MDKRRSVSLAQHNKYGSGATPWNVLALIISTESVFLTIFVLISQGRMARQSERRSDLDLQVGMLTEQELTTTLTEDHESAPESPGVSLAG